MSAVITFRIGPDRTVLLERGKVLVVGRAPEVDVTIADPRVSRRHCELTLEEQGVVVADLGSANGTGVNGQAIKRALLRDGDLLRVGEVDVKLEIQYQDEVLAPTFSARCRSCDRAIELATCSDSRVIEVSDDFVCPSCAQKGPVDVASQREVEIIRRLERDGYQVGPRLSTIGIAPVFRAVKQPLGRVVAVKALHLSTATSKERVQRFAQAAKAGARLRHPNIVTVFDIQFTHDIVYIVMDLVEGRTLAQELERATRLSARDALRIGHDVARALAHAHEMGVVHRDVSPSNVMLTPEGDAKLIDFGLAKNLWDLSESSKAITGEGVTLGTVGYMAPEQVETAREADHRADLYGLGATLHHCLSGEAPFKLPTRASRASVPPLGADVPPVVIALVAKLLQRKPEDRFQTSGDAIEAIERAVGELCGVPGARGAAAQLLLKADDRHTVNSTLRVKLPDAVFRGRLGEEDDLFEFLQLVELKKKTGLLRIHSDGMSGTIFVRGGRIVSAERLPAQPPGLDEAWPTGQTPISTGDRAARDLLSIRSGEFEFLARPASIKVNVDLPIAKLLLELSRARDETGRFAKPPLDLGTA